MAKAKYPETFSMKKGEERTARVGEVFFEHTGYEYIRKGLLRGWHQFSYTFEITEIAEEKVGLKYTRKPTGPHLIEQSSFALWPISDKQIIELPDWKGRKIYRFKVLECVDDWIRYKRVK